jgi:hypothetical protein
MVTTAPSRADVMLAMLDVSPLASLRAKRSNLTPQIHASMAEIASLRSQ